MVFQPKIAAKVIRSAGTRSEEDAHRRRDAAKDGAMLGTLLLIVLILLLVGAFPAWPHSSSWGYGPSGLVGILVLVLVVLLLMGRI
jgi:hypothetical protein